jgi:hypothetical protein
MVRYAGQIESLLRERGPMTARQLYEAGMGHELVYLAKALARLEAAGLVRRVGAVVVSGKPPATLWDLSER